MSSVKLQVAVHFMKGTYHPGLHDRFSITLARPESTIYVFCFMQVPQGESRSSILIDAPPGCAELNSLKGREKEHGWQQEFRGQMRRGGGPAGGVEVEKLYLANKVPRSFYYESTVFLLVGKFAVETRPFEISYCNPRM